MPNILKPPGKVHAARNFLKSFYDAGGTERIYIGIGTRTGPWGVPASPDVPVNSYDAEQEFMQYLIGMVQVTQATGTDLIVPRKTWVTDTHYYVFSESLATGSGSFNITSGRGFYICNTDASPKVYILKTKGGGTSINMPTHKNPAGAGAGGDGYDWKYLYTIDNTDVSAVNLTNSWMPVPSSAIVWAVSQTSALGRLVQGDGSGNFYTDQIYIVTATTGNTTGANMNADTNNTYAEWQGRQQLGAFYVAASAQIPDYAATGSIIPNSEYRQVALLRNPLLATGARVTATYQSLTLPSALESYTTLNRGTVMTLDNRTDITRTNNQIETIRVILEF